MRHRFADVADALADEGYTLVKLPFVLNVDDQQDVLRERLGASLCIVRAFYNYVHSTGWLTRPTRTWNESSDRANGYVRPA